MILWATHLRSVAAVHFQLTPGIFSLGRATADDPEEKLSVPFDKKLSRRMARIEVKPTRVIVQRDGSRAPLFIEGVEKDNFVLIPGQRFSVAETTFELVLELAQTVTADELEEARHNSPEEMLELMVAVQPILNKETSTEELVPRINQVLPVTRVALFQTTPAQQPEGVPLVPSKSLIAQACQTGEPVFYEWGDGKGQPTAAQGESWALAAPILVGEEQLVLYAVGHQTAGKLERGALCLLAQMLKDHLEARRGESAAAALDQLKTDFDPRVRKATERALKGDDDQQITLKVRSLGEFEAYLNGERLDKQWGGKQLSWLLSYLTSSETAVGEDQLVDAFWPDKARGKKNLTVALSRLRKHLQPGLNDNPIPLNSTGYAVDQALSFWHDYQELDGLLDFILRRSETEQAEKIISGGERLAELYRGEYLKGCYLDWAVRRRTELEQRLQQAYELVAEVALKSENFEQALTNAQRSLEFDPCAQGCHLISLRAYVGQSKPERAVRQFEHCKRILAQELELEPSTELIEAYHRARLALP